MNNSIIISVVALLVVVGGFWYVTEKQEDLRGEGENASSTELQKTIDEARASVPEVVATVNGEEITSEDFFRSGEQVAQQAQANGSDISNPSVQSQISNQAMQIIVNQILLAQEAEKAGTVASTTAVEEQYNTIVEASGGEQAFLSQLEEVGVTKEKVMEDLSRDSKIRVYLVQKLGLDVLEASDEEKEELYEQVKTNGGTSTPSYEELSEDLETQVKINKERELINTYLQELQDGADIVINL